MVNQPTHEASHLKSNNTKSNLKRLLIRIATVVVVVVIGYFIWTKTHPPAKSSLITAKITTGDLIETVSAAGSVTAQTGAEVHVGSQIAGTIKKLSTDVGSHVVAGQIIAELSLPDLVAQLNAAKASLAQAETKYQQALLGVPIVQTQTSSAQSVAEQLVLSAKEKLKSAIAGESLQKQTTASDIAKARTVLTTAQSSLVQTQAGANLNIATAQESVVQAKANAANSHANLIREQSLFSQDFVSASDLDAAKALDAVYQSQVRSSTQNVALVQQKVVADLQTARDAVASASASLKAAESESQSNLSSAANVRDAQTAVNQAESNLKTAIANQGNDTIAFQTVDAAQQAVSQATALVAYNQAEVNKTFIRSPISGTVLQLSAQQGETVSAGLSTQTLITVADLKKLEIDAYVDESDISKIKIGQTANCTIDAFPNEIYKGKVTTIASGSTIQQGVVTYDVTLAIDSQGRQLKPDMTANVTIQVGKITNAVVVPAVAVHIGSNGSTVNVLDVKNGKQTIFSTPVVTGGTDGVNIEIKSGLTTGQTIVLAGTLTSSSPSKGASSPFSAPPRGGPPHG